MKRLFCTLTFILWVISVIFGQDKITNRYSMTLTKAEDGTYSLENKERYEAILTLDNVPDLLMPYTYVPDQISKEDYSGIETRRYTYKTYPGYELELEVDLPAGNATPAPFMVYVHGGGWQRGTLNSNKLLSHLLAKQHGIAGVRISYTLSPQPGADIRVTIKDVQDALELVKGLADELNLDSTRYGFSGASAGAHLGAVGALTTDALVFVGFAGIYDLTRAAITAKATQPERVAYFRDKDPEVLREASPVYLIRENKNPACLLVCGTGDITVEYEQSLLFADALQAVGSESEVAVYDYYGHGINSKSSGIMEEVLLKAVSFIAGKLKP